MNFIRNSTMKIIFVICVSFLSFSKLQAQNETGIPPPHCYQQRPQTIEENLGCNKYIELQDFCSTIQCEPIDDCIEDEHTAIVQNITGRGCCPACVQYIEIEGDCEIGAVLKRCRNGLFCDPSTKKCDLPPNPKRCMQEVYNRQIVKNSYMSFYVEGQGKLKKPMYFEIKYASDIEYPTCAPQTGEYEPKQCRGSKCFCVRPEDGKPTFGLTVKDSSDGSSENVTCECSEEFRKKLKVGTGKIEDNKAYMEHYAQIHSKCDSSGNYEPLQCINSTCFCVDEKTGRPLMEKVAIYGALLSLSCFDKEKSKALGSKDSDIYYQNECEKQLMRTQQISLHFMDKGTDLIGLDKISCSYDGKFAAKQCKPEMCNCVMPNDAGIAMPTTYQVDRSGGKDFAMDCRCAQQIYYVNMEKKGYDRPQCEGNGNFKAYQSFDSGLKTYCIDENGARISEIVSSACYDQFVQIEPALANLKEDVCISMRQLLTDVNMEQDKFYKFDTKNKVYDLMTNKPPDDQLFCLNSGIPECGCKNKA